MNGSMIRIGLVAMALGVAAAWAEENEMSKEQLPAPVLAAAMKACPGGAIDEIEKEMEEGAVVYEIEMTVDGKGCELTIAPDGTVLEIEQEIAPEKLPKKVKATLKKFEGATVEKAESEQENGEVSYEVIIVMDGQRIELEITEKGKITELEVKGKKHDDDDEDDDD